MSSYIGDNPFLFFSYCHADREEVFRIADAVDKAGYRVWYDKAISGAELDDKTAERISASRIFILFLSKSYLRMPHCDMGMKHAMNYNCTCFAVYLEDVDLSRKAALEMGLRPANNLYKFKMPEEEFLQKLCSSSLLQECKYDKNEPHDGVVLQEEPIKRAPLEYDLLGVLIFLMLALAFLQSSWYLGYLGTNISAIPQVFLFFYSFSLLRQEESLYQCTTTRNSPASTMALLLLCLSYGMLLPRLAHGGTAVQVCVGVLCCIVHFLLLILVTNDKKSLPNADSSSLLCYIVRILCLFLMLCMFDFQYRWAACVQFFLTCGGLLVTFGQTYSGLERKEPRSYAILGGCGLLMLLCAVTGFVLLSPAYDSLLTLAEQFSRMLYRSLP